MMIGILEVKSSPFRKCFVSNFALQCARFVYEKWEATELSIDTIPSNPFQQENKTNKSNGNYMPGQRQRIGNMAKL